MSKTSLTPALLPADPSLALHAATKQYVDAGDSVHISVSTWAATVNVDGTGLDFVRLTLGGDTTINMTGGTDGRKLILDLKQDGSGGHVVTLGTGFKFGTDITSFVNSLGIGKTDHLGLLYVAADSAYHVLAVAHAF